MKCSYELPGDRYWYPIPVPIELSVAKAKDYFDKGWRVFMVPKKFLMTPDDQFDPKRLKYAYSWSDWWQSGVLPPNELVFWQQLCAQHNPTPLNPHVKLFNVWPRIMSHASRQPFVKNPFAAPSSALDFYVFEEPTILIRKVTTVPSKPFIAYNDRGNNRWLFLQLVQK